MPSHFHYSIVYVTPLTKSQSNRENVFTATTPAEEKNMSPLYKVISTLHSSVITI
uniref:Uncharacterized protein n=1 Tax=Oryza brachyantha TaxID=4533 RepID=J3MR51_ORYBR